MPAATTPTLPLSPTLDEARELAREHNVIPLRHVFIDDCETPVSAFLKLRGGGPAFLLESRGLSFSDALQELTARMPSSGERS